MMIGGLQKTTLIDYPGKVAAIVFTAGCNFNCHYCYNPELRNFSPKIDESEFFDFLDKRKKHLDAITVTGGEPTVQPDLVEFIEKIKKRGFLVKLDTQGTNPKMVEQLIDAKLIDYIAMDIKAPLERYREVANCFVDESAIKKSIALVMEKAPDYEFRTTVVKDQLKLEDIEKMGDLIKGAKRYYLQCFVSTKNMNDPSFCSRKGPSVDEMESMRVVMSKYVKEAFVR
ncbi:MAG: anaerobic ribonucleoside-triphosphate reductase activating protein [Candidatus Paceibacterota bacterium]|jgi:pyruvate formate lyase activating enzyme